MRKPVVAAALSLAALGAAPSLAQTTPATPSRGLGMTRADVNGDGVVSRAEATAQADMQFDAADADRDGKVTGDEMRAAAAARARTGGRGIGGRFGGSGGDVALTRDDYRARALARFDHNDANHDGNVDQAEMAAARQERMERRGQGIAAQPQQ
jgi:hypothetical protein